LISRTIGVPNVVAVAAGGACFWLLNFYVLTSLSVKVFPALASFGDLLFLALLLLPGLITGALAHRSPITHGVLLGVLVTVLAVARPVPMSLGGPPRVSFFVGAVSMSVCGVLLGVMLGGRGRDL
jgi:hypothetical protein